MIAALTGSLFAVLSRRAERGGDLVDRAALLVAADAWRGTAPPGGGKGSGTFFWRNNREVLRFARRVTGKTAIITPYQLTLSTGEVHAIPGAPRLTKNQRPLSVSPDGTWLLCVDRAASPPRLFAAALDGTGRRHMWKPAETGADICWFRDNSGFVSSLYDWRAKKTMARVYRLGETKPGEPTRLVDKAGAAGGNAARLFPLGQLPEGRFIACDMATINGIGVSNAPSATLTEFSLPANVAATPPGVITVRAPPPKPITRGAFGGAMSAGALLFSARRAYLSPQGDRLLWVVTTFEYTSAYGAWGGGPFRRVLPYVYRAIPLRFRPQSSFRNRYELFTARVDGRGGLIPAGAFVPQNMRTATPHDIGWTPDGKRIAFTYKGALYAVRADKP